MTLNYDKYLADSAEQHYSQEGYETIIEILHGDSDKMENKMQTHHNLQDKVIQEIHNIWDDAKKYLGVGPSYDLQQQFLQDQTPGKLIQYIKEMGNEFSHISISDEVSIYYDTQRTLEMMQELGFLKETQHLFIEFNGNNLEQQQKFVQTIEEHYKDVYLEGLYLQSFKDDSSIVVQPPAIKTAILSIDLQNSTLGIKEIEKFREKFADTKELILHGIGDDFKFPSHTNLTHLTCRECGLKEISEEILSNDNLEYLDLSYNQIRQIPEGLAKLPIHKLYLNDNEIKKGMNLPYITLNELNISNNEIDAVSKEMACYVVTNYLYIDREGIDISKNCINLKSADDSTWSMIVGCLGVEKTHEVFLSKQMLPFSQSQEYQISQLEVFTKKKDLKTGLKL